MLVGANEKPEGRQRLSSAERKEAIVRTAMELFAKNGFRGTTTRELAAAVGVSEPVLYQHFPSKSDLFTAMVERMVCDVAERFQCLLASDSSELEEEVYFQQLGEQVLGWYVDGARNVRLLLFSALEGHELARIWHEKATVHFEGSIVGYLKARAERNGYELGDPRVTARAFIGMVAHFGMIWGIFYPNEFEFDRTQVVKRFVQIFLDGIRQKRVEGSHEASF